MAPFGLTHDRTRSVGATPCWVWGALSWSFDRTETLSFNSTSFTDLRTVKKVSDFYFSSTLARGVWYMAATNPTNT